MQPNGHTSQTVVCTIVSKNYLHYARTLMASVQQAHPDWRRCVLLVDEVEGAFDPAREPFEVLEVARLPLPGKKKFLYRYSILELNTAVKPWLLDWLFKERGADRVVYLDPDIFVYRPLADVQAALDRGALMVLTPHLTGELDEGRVPDEHHFLRCGCYNLGFLAVSRCEGTDAFLRWWQRKLEFDCRVDFRDNLFVDQKWLDLAPGLFAGVEVLRHPGYNVAYWNLHHRRVEKRGREFTVNGQPLVFFHYSGLDPRSPERLSRYQDRFRLSDLGPAAELVTRYCGQVLANGLETCRRWRYAFDRLADGTPVTDLMRQCYRRSLRAQKYCGDDPFTIAHDYLNEPWGSKRLPLVTVLMRALWRSRKDLRRAFPDIDVTDRHNFVRCYLTDLVREEKIPEPFVAPVRESVERLNEPWGRQRQPLVTRLMRSLWESREDLRIAFPDLDGKDRRRFARHFRLVLACEEGVPAEYLAPVARSLDRSAVEVVAAQVRRANRLVATSGLNQVLARLKGSPRPATPAPAPSSPPPPARGPGLNIIGYVQSEHGVGESARACARAAEAAGVPFTLHDFTTGNPNRTADHTWARRLGGPPAHWVNVFHINADQMPIARAALGEAFFAGHYNIGFWHWELPEFPDEWLGSFDLVDELWAPTRFVVEALAARSPVPVVRMPHSIRFPVDAGLGRDHFGLPEDRFLFLAMYDAHSFAVRKNPRGAIEAFRRAFPDPRDVALVVKVNNPEAAGEEVRELRAAGPGVHVIDRVLSRREVYALEGCCDALVSLHRAEGFGLCPAECMFLGKPVVATGWSGNADFMDADNSCPVRYELVTLDRDHGPYRRGQTWAEPDVEHAAWYLARLVAEPAWRQALAAKGRQTILTHHSPEAIGQRYLARLAAIHRRRDFRAAA